MNVSMGQISSRIPKPECVGHLWGVPLQSPPCKRFKGFPNPARTGHGEICADS